MAPRVTVTLRFTTLLFSWQHAGPAACWGRLWWWQPCGPRGGGGRGGRCWGRCCRPCCWPRRRRSRPSRGASPPRRGSTRSWPRSVSEGVFRHVVHGPLVRTRALPRFALCRSPAHRHVHGHLADGALAAHRRALLHHAGPLREQPLPDRREYTVYRLV